MVRIDIEKASHGVMSSHAPAAQVVAQLTHIEPVSFSKPAQRPVLHPDFCLHPLGVQDN